MLCCALLADVRLGGRRPGRRARAALPGSRRLRSRRPRACGQLLVVGAGVGAPVVFVQVHEHFEHESTIPAAARAVGASGRRRPARQARATRWNRPPGRRATRPSSSSSSRRACSSAALPAGARDQRVERRPGRSRARRAAGRRRRLRRRALRAASAGGRGAAGAAPRARPARDSTSLAPCLISAWQPRDCGEWIEPGIANTSRPASAASRAVISEPDCSAASTTSVPRARPAMMRLRCGKFVGQRRRAERVFADDQARRRRCGAPASRWRCG